MQENNKFIFIVGNKPVSYLSFIFLLQCRYSDEFIIKTTDINLSKAEELLRLYKNLGIKEENRERKIETVDKNGKTYKLYITEIECRKIGAIRL